MPLYACSTGRADDDQKLDDIEAGPGGDGGYADELRDAFARGHATHCRVDARATLGHATRTPFVQCIEGRGELAGWKGGQWLVEPRGPLWGSWGRALRESDIQHRFPFMTASEVHAELERGLVA